MAWYPKWFAQSARISSIQVTGSVKDQIAQYETGTRKIYLIPNAGTMLMKAVGHELAHGADDNFGNLHYFSSNSMWTVIHKNGRHFDLPKYADEQSEYFADMLVKCLMFGVDRIAMTQPAEAAYIAKKVIPLLVEFGREQTG
jgi:hypothetical protein